MIAESAADAVQTWSHTEADGRCITLNAKIWFGLLLPPQKTWTESDRNLNQKHVWVLMAIQHPDFEHPLILIMSNIKLTPDEMYTVFRLHFYLFRICVYVLNDNIYNFPSPNLTSPLVF